jgi:hypothetical protein
MLLDILFFLFYFKLSEIYVSNQMIFRAFHCTSLALLSLKNTFYYGTQIINFHSSLQTLYSAQPLTLLSSNYYSEDFYLKIIPVYFILYIVYDLKNCTKRIDLFFHHVVCIIWGLLNFNSRIGLISFAIFPEGVTFAYMISTFKYQLIYRLLFTTIFRFPVWTIMIYAQYTMYVPRYDFMYVLNETITVIMILMDCVWCFQNYKKLKKICNAVV